ncbi:MAG: methionine--tRNA ligase subunit beta, partial [Oscillospiraceae bacterium]
IRFISVMLLPILPQTSQCIFEQLGSDKTDFDSLITFGVMKYGTKVGIATPIFNRIEEAKFFEELNVLQQEEEKQVDGLTSFIEIGDFSKVSLIVAKIIDCERIPKSDKLLLLQLDDGTQTRQVASGIATWYDKNALIGKNVILVANLKPAKLRGVLSQGMILAADISESKVEVIFVDDTILPGSKIR